MENIKILFQEILFKKVTAVSILKTYPSDLGLDQSQPTSQKLILDLQNKLQPVIFRSGSCAWFTSYILSVSLVVFVSEGRAL